MKTPEEFEIELKKLKEEIETYKWGYKKIKDGTAVLYGELKQAEKKYKTIVENINDAFYLHDFKGKILDTNDRACEMTGYTRKELIGGYSSKLDTPEQAKLMPGRVKSIIKSGNLLFEGQHRRKDGTVFDVVVSAKVVSKEGNGLIEAFVRDITERKKAEQELKESEERFKGLFENMSESVAVYEVKNNGKDIIIRDFNKAAEKIEKVDKNNIIGKKVDEVFSGVKKMGLYNVFINVWKTGKSQNFPLSFYKDKIHMGWRDNFVFKLNSGEIVAIYSDVTERMQEQEELKESEKKYHSVVTQNPRGMHFYQLINNRLIFIDANPSADNILGIDNKKLFGKTIDQAFPLLVETAIPKKYLEVVKTGKAWAAEVPYHSGDISGVFDVTAFKISENKMAASFTDISEQKKIEEENLENLEKYQRLFECAKDSILILDSETGKITDSNPFIEELLGYSKEELLGKRIFEISPFKNIFINKEKFLELKNKKYVRYENLPLQTKNGEKVFVEFVSNVYDVGKKQVVQCNIRDITGRKKIEQQAKEYLDRLKIASRAGKIGIWDWDILKDNLICDDTICEIYGVPHGVFKGGAGKWSKHIIPEDRARTWSELQAAMRGEREYCPEFRIKWPHGDIHNIQAHSQAFFDKNGKAIRMVGTNVDITEIRKAEKELKEAKENVDKLVLGRTAELNKAVEDLKQKNLDLERFNQAAIDRELKMVELKKKIAKLEAKSGKNNED